VLPRVKVRDKVIINRQRWAHALRCLFGWRSLLPEYPPVAKAVIVFYPHTSNWDFVWGMLTRLACGWPIQWIGKHTIFRGPLNALLRRLGGIPINRSVPGGFVDAVADEFRKRDTLLIAIAPEGTRKYAPYWKSGFYRIALAAGVPVLLAYIDYAKREVGLCGQIILTGDSTTDMAKIAAAYADKTAHVQANASPVHLHSE
jgi:1-acyl-sn-glycerol-3-phosphate acyltransferase